MQKTFFSTGLIDGANAPADPAGGADPAESGTPPVLLQYWAAFARRKWLIAAIMTVALAAGLIATLLATPQYRAAAKIEISRNDRDPTEVNGVEGRISDQDQEFYQTQYTLLVSSSLAERVARQLSLADNPAFFEAHSLSPPSPSMDARSRVRFASSVLLDGIEVVPIARSRLVDVVYTSNSPEIAAQISNAWVENFIQSSIDRKFASTREAREFLEGRIAELGARLENEERQAVAFATNKGIVTLASSTDDSGQTQTTQTLASAQLQGLNEALSQAVADRVAAEAARNSPVNTSMVENQAISVLRQQRADLAGQYAQLMAQFTPEYPEAKAIQRRIAALDQAIGGEERRVNRARFNAYSEALQRENALRARVTTLASRLNQESRDEIQYNIYLRNADTTRQLYNTLLQRYSELGVAGVSANNIAIVDRAEPPSSPSSPSLITNLFIALVLGAALAGLVVLVLEQIDEGLRDPADVRRLLGIPLLGAVPDQEGEDLWELLQDAKSEISEAYISVQTSLAFSTDHGVPRSLMVTSSRPNEGKSITSYALATVLARMGRRVLLIDADMRNPSIHRIENTRSEAGLSNALAGDQKWKDYIRPSAQERFALMTAGPTPPSASELLGKDALQRILGELSQEYDHVILDAPPLLNLADAPLLARSVEGCVFVIEAGGVPIRGLRSALGRLTQAKAKTFGAVVTKLRRQSTQYGYGHGYGYGYGYGHDRASHARSVSS